MILCSGTSRQGTRVRRYGVAIALEPALRALMRLYDQDGGARPEAAGRIEGEIEQCLAERGSGADQKHAHLQQWLRVRDLHQFIVEDPALTSLKLRLFEYLLYHRGSAARWAGARELLLAEMDRLCATPVPGLRANLEAYKQALSNRDGPLGRLLLTVALFNLDLEDERPPENLVLRFRRGRFPLHWWELGQPGGRTAHLGTVEHWNPTNPLCRWEYLATDLAQALFRKWLQPAGHPGASLAAAGSQERLPGGAAGSEEIGQAETVYCGSLADAHGAGPAQLELFPLESGTLLAGLLRTTHRRHGPEGVKLLAVLCGAWREATATRPLELSLPRLAAEAGLGTVSARGLRARVGRLEKIIAELAQVELTRVTDPGGSRSQTGQRARTTRLLTVLGRSTRWPQASGQASDATAGEDSDGALWVLVDPCAFAVADGGLVGAFADLPPLLLECAGPDHPGLLPLYVWLRRQWSVPGAELILECTARSLLHEAGIWVSDSGRYRAVEALKRDLEFMREQGWLGSWRLHRSESRDALEDRYRLGAPGARAPAASPFAAPPREALPGSMDGPAALTGT